MPEIKSIIRVEFYSTTAPGRVFDPYDCAKQTAGSGGNNTKYCLQSRFYSCATRVHCPIPEIGSECAVDDMAKLAPFLKCAEDSSGPSGLSSFDNALPCAQKYGLDVDKILECYDPTDISYTSPALATIDAVNNATDAATDPAVAYFPDVRVAGKQLRDPTATSLTKAVCAAYSGPQPPPACAVVE